jgi:phosphinothricin acetyltransferase
MSPTLEPAERKDVPDMLSISNWAALHTNANLALEPETLEQWLASFDAGQLRYPWLVARQLDSVVGFAKAGPHRARGAYAWTAETSVYVHPDCHGQGIGGALYDHLLRLLRDQGFVTLFAGITAGNAASEALHLAKGFRRCGVLHRAGWKFGRWHDVGFWELDLRPDEPPPTLRGVAEATKTESTDPFPESLCHRCGAPPRFVKTKTSTFIFCPLLPNKYPPQPVTTCPCFTPLEPSEPGKRDR